METENNKNDRNKIPCGVCRVKCDKVFTIIWANDRYYKMFGYTEKEEQAKITGVKQIIYPGDFQRLIRMLHKKLRRIHILLNVNTVISTKTGVLCG